MARTFVGASGQAIDLGDQTTWEGVANLTISVWWARSFSNAFGIIGSRPTSAGLINLGINFFSDSRCYLNVGAGGAAAYGSFASNSTTAVHVAMAYDGGGGANADRLKGYLNGAAQTLTFSGTVPATTPNTGNFYVGRDLISGYSNGTGAELGIWLATLTADENAALADGASPLLVRPDALAVYLPLIGRSSPEPDVMGLHNGTLVGTPAQADHVRIIRRRRAQIFVPKVAAGGGVTVNAPSTDISVAAQAPSVSTGKTIAVPAGNVAIAASAPAVNTGKTVAVPSVDIAIAAQAPSVTAGSTIGASVDVPSVDVVIAVQAPTIAAGKTITVPAAAIAISAVAPSVSTTSELAGRSRRRGRRPIYELDGSKKKYLRRRCAKNWPTSQPLQPRPIYSRYWTSSEYCRMH